MTLNSNTASQQTGGESASASVPIPAPRQDSLSQQQQKETMNSITQLFPASENFEIDDAAVDELQVLPPSAQNEDVDFPFLFWDMDDGTGGITPGGNGGGGGARFNATTSNALIPNLNLGETTTAAGLLSNQIFNPENLLLQQQQQQTQKQQDTATAITAVSQQQAPVLNQAPSGSTSTAAVAAAAASSQTGLNSSAQNFLNEVANQIVASLPQMNTGTGNFPFALTNQGQGMEGSSSSSTNLGKHQEQQQQVPGGNFQQQSNTAPGAVWNPLLGQQQQQQSSLPLAPVSILPKVSSTTNKNDASDSNSNNTQVQPQQQQIHPYLNALNPNQLMNNIAFSQQQQQQQQQQHQQIQSVIGNKNQQDPMQSLQIIQQMQQKQPQSSLMFGQNNLMLPPQQQYNHVQMSNNQQPQGSGGSIQQQQVLQNEVPTQINPSSKNTKTTSRKRQLDDKGSTTTTTSSISSSKANIVSSSDTDGEVNAATKRSRVAQTFDQNRTNSSTSSAIALKSGDDCDEKDEELMKPEEEMTEEEKAQANRIRNREHARNTRARKKAYLESLKTTLDELCRERDTLVSERAGAASLLLEMQKTRTDVLLSFFALRSSYEKKRAIWSSILDEGIACIMPVTPYRSFPASEVQISKCQRNIMGIDGMISDAASLHVLLNSLVDRSKFPAGVVQFRYTLVAEEAVVSGNQMMARWSMTTLNATSLGANKEIRKSGMLCARFNSSHKIVALELMFDVMAFMLQLKQSAGAQSFAMVPNTVQTCVGPFGSTPMVVTLSERPYTITQVNNAWEEMTCWNADEVVMKKSCKILQGVKTEQSATETLMSNVRFQRPALAAFTNYDKNGRLFRNFMNIFPLSTDSKITHYVGFTVHFEKMNEIDKSAITSEEDVSTKAGT